MAVFMRRVNNVMLAIVLLYIGVGSFSRYIFFFLGGGGGGGGKAGEANFNTWGYCKMYIHARMYMLIHTHTRTHTHMHARIHLHPDMKINQSKRYL